MGNRFGNYPTYEDAARVLTGQGYEAHHYDGLKGEYFTKVTTDGCGFPMTAMVEITEERVAAEYTESGADGLYYQHHFF